ncbi:hypothetical protein BDZ97DRAFT_1852767 [Flammula alnicola]|nr:hypothetical protein BDZ97DRAFT_1852767 [Flammula alnicola]
MFPTELPAEITILILSYLPLPTLSVLLRLNAEWFDFIGQNGNTIYHNAAFLQGYIPSHKTLIEELRPTEAGTERQALYSRRATEGIHGWKDMCRKRKMIQRSWAGLAPSSILPSPRTLPSPIPSNLPGNNPHRRIHRIKVDEKAGIIMTTTGVGGLMVRDLETDEVLWELPRWYVRGFAHLEYGEGYMIFDRDDGNKEVWRRTADITDPAPPALVTSFPDDRQRYVANYVNNLTSTTSLTATQRKAQFSPHSVLRMPDATRAYRFVYPTLLVVSLERAFIWDVRTGVLIQTIEDIQVVRPIGASQDEEHAQVDEGSTSAHSETAPDEGEDESHQHSPAPDTPPADIPPVVLDEDDDDDELPQFLGLVRYVDLSERHVFLAGRYLLRVFSRTTGKCVFDVPATRWRYGSSRWELASRADQHVALNLDTYEQAQGEGRELVRMPLRFSYDEYRQSERMVIDQFVAVHVSSDGQHFVAMLSGSRLIIMHHFESLLNKRAQNAASRSTRSLSQREIKEETKRAQEEKDREIFEHTLDVQLGSPQASSSIYLAYENGRIGVVTTNAVYIVTPTIPPLPTTPRTTPNIQNLTVSRLPYFSNPSWLGAVSCLMMSDTGLYLNWNPTAPIQADDPHDRETWADWEREFEEYLEDYERNELDRYHLLPNGDMFVAPIPRALEISEVSTVYSVDFAVESAPPSTLEVRTPSVL